MYVKIISENMGIEPAGSDICDSNLTVVGLNIQGPVSVVEDIYFSKSIRDEIVGRR